MVGQFLYNRLSIKKLLTRVEIEKDSIRISRLSPKSTAILGVMKKNVTSGSNNADT